jgi:hypothetical protein
VSTIPTTGLGGSRPFYVAGLILIAAGCFAFAAGRTMQTNR